MRNAVFAFGSPIKQSARIAFLVAPAVR